MEPTDVDIETAPTGLVVPTVTKAVNLEVATGSVETMLTTIIASCDDMDELKDACKFLSKRLVNVVSELMRLESAGQLPANEVLVQFPTLLTKFLSYLKRYADKGIIARLTQHERRVDQLKDLHKELDEFATACGLLSTTSEWTQQWPLDCAAQLALLKTVVDDDDKLLHGLRDSRAQIEALTQLKFYLGRRLGTPGTPPDELTKLLQTASTTIGQEASTQIPTLPLWYVPSDEVEFEAEPFAQGSFGSVHHGTWQAGEPVVVKRLLVKSGMSEILKERFIDEVSIWHKLDHPNVLKLFGASHVSSPPFFVCQRASLDNMATYLASSPRARRNMWQLLFGAAQGLAYIHKNYIVHGDLKLNNILVDQSDENSPVVARVGDFGLSFVRPSAQAVQPLDAGADASARPRGGGLRWRSPESLKKRPTFASDVYSLAMCIIEAVTGEPPYGGLDDEHVHKELKEGNIPSRPEEFTDDAWVLVQSMAQFEPSGRLSLNEVLTVLEDFANVEKADNITMEAELAQAEASETRTVEPAPSSPRGRRNTGSTPGAGIVPLVQLLRAGTSDQIQYAIHALRELAANTEENRRDIVKAGAIPVLADLVNKGSSKSLVDEATSVLQLLANEGDTCVLIVEAGCTAALLPLLQSGSIQQKQAVAFSLSTFLSGEDGTADIPVDENAIQSLVDLLGSGNEGQKLYAAKALSNLAYSHATDATIKSEAVIAPLLKLVQSGNDEQSLYALKALAWLSSQASVCATIADASGVAAFVAQLYTLGEDHQQFALTAISHLAKASSVNCVEIKKVGGIEPLVELLRGEPGALKELATTIIERMTESNKDLCAAVFDAGVVPPLVEILRIGASSEKISAAKTVGHLATLQPSSGKSIISAGAVPLLVGMFQSGDESQKTVAGITLKALLRDEESCLAIADNGGYAIIFEVLQKGSEDQKRAAVFAIAVSFAVDSDPASHATKRRLAPLIDFLSMGSDVQKTLVIKVFAKMASISLNRSSLVAAGIVAPLVKLVESHVAAHKSAATALLGQLATEEEGVDVIIEHGGVRAVAVFLASSGGGADAEAALTLGNLANDPTHCAAIAAIGVIPPTMQLLRTGRVLQQERAAYLIAKLAQDTSVHTAIAACDGVKLFESLLVQTDATTAQKEHAAMALAGVLQSPQDGEAVTGLELLTALVGLLDAGNDGAKLGAATCLAAISKQHPTSMAKFLECEIGAHMVPLLIALLRTGVGGQREQAALALGHCASLNESVQQTIVKTGGIEVMARQLQSRTESATAQTLPLLKALAPVPAHAATFQAAKVVSTLASVATGNGSEKQKLQIVDTLLAFPTLPLAEAGDVIATAQQLLRSESVAEREAAATLMAHASASAPKLVAQRGAVSELVVVLGDGSSTAKLAALKALHALADESSAKDALKTAGVVDAVVKLLDGVSDSDPVVAPAEKLAVSLGRSKLMARETVDKWLLPRLEAAVATGSTGARPELARDAIASFRTKRSSFSLGGRARSMSSEQSNA